MSKNQDRVDELTARLEKVDWDVVRDTLEWASEHLELTEPGATSSIADMQAGIRALPCEGDFDEDFTAAD